MKYLLDIPTFLHPQTRAAVPIAFVIGLIAGFALTAVLL